MIGTLAGIEYQLGTAAHFEDVLERIKYLEAMGPPDIAPDDLRDLATLRAFIDRARKGLGMWRGKLTAMMPPLYKEANQLRHKRTKPDYGNP